MASPGAPRQGPLGVQTPVAQPMEVHFRGKVDGHKVFGGKGYIRRGKLFLILSIKRGEIDVKLVYYLKYLKSSDIQEPVWFATLTSDSSDPLGGRAQP